ncbi:hypothetical protein LRP88_14300 [Fusarium phalaenopsidis]|nr:hypothetical protein NCS56_00217300 [Fusarium sp. Ph1]
MHFNTVAGLALSLAGSASAFYTPKLPASGLCPNNQYWDTAKGCKNLPPPAKCSSSNQYYDTLKGCVRGKPPSGPPGLLCTVVKTLVTVARQQLPASSFCSSYLSIPVVTKTATVTAYTKVITNTNTVTSGVTTVIDSTKTITDSTITTTIIEPSTLSTKTTSTSVISAVSTTTVTACANPVTRKARRALGPTGYKTDPTWLEEHGFDPVAEEKRGLIPKPKCFANYVDPAAVSYACNCLSVPTRTTTSYTTLRTKTATAVTTVPSTEKATATEKVTATDTKTSTQLVATVYTETIVERSTTYTSTHTALSPTFTIVAASGRYTGKYLYDANSRGYASVDFAGPMLLFTLGDDGTLTAQNQGLAGQFAVSDPDAGSYNAIPAFKPLSGKLQKLVVTVTQESDGTCPLTFQGARGSASFECGTYWRVGSEDDLASFGGCHRIDMIAVGSEDQ